MTSPAQTQKPWEVRRSYARPLSRLPDFNDLDDKPQLGPVALLKVAAQIATSALHAHYGPASTVADEVTCSAECVEPLLARVITLHCDELVQLLEAYQLAVQRPEPDDDELF